MAPVPAGATWCSPPPTLLLNSDLRRPFLRARRLPQWGKKTGVRDSNALARGNSAQRCGSRALLASAAPLVPQADADAFRRDGAVCLRGILSPAEVEILRKGVDHNLAHPSPRAKTASASGDPGLFVEDFCTWQVNSSYRHIIMTSALAEVARELMGSRTVRLHHDHMLTKEGGTRQRTPWHQDLPYYNIDGHQTVSFWIPVDPVSRAASLEFVAGSHRGPWCTPRTFLTNEAKWFPDGQLEEMPDVEGNRDKFRILGWDVQPGDAVAFHMLTWHAAGGVEEGRRRRVFSLRLVGDDVTHAPRPWQTSPDFPGLGEEVPAGAPLDHPLFPLLLEERITVS